MQADHASPIEYADELGHALALGLGRAILFLRQRDATPYHELLLHHTLHWTGHDQQIEGTRTTYLLDVLDAAGLTDEFLEPVLAALRETTNSRDFEQLLYLTLAYAKDGNEAARAAIYGLFDNPNPDADDDEPYQGAVEVIKLDGLAGLLYVAERIGAALLTEDGNADSDAWRLSYPLSVAEEQCGKEETRRALTAASTDSPQIAAFAQAAITGRDEERPYRQYEFRDATYAQVKQAIHDPARWRPTGRVRPRKLVAWGRDASDEEIAQAATDFLAEHDADRLAAYVQIFQERRFPLAPDRLLALLRRPLESDADRWLVASAADALSLISHPQVRETALAMLADDTLSSWMKRRAVELLTSNFEPGDESLLAALLAGEWDNDDLHWIGRSVRDILTAHPSRAAIPVLLTLYERGPCVFCREHIVDLWHQIRPLPAWMLKECRLDASSDIRDLAEAWASGDNTLSLSTLGERQAR